MDKTKIRQLFEESQYVQLPQEIESRVNPSSLSRETLQFIGKLVEFYRPQTVLEFGSGVSTLFLSKLLAKDNRAHLYSVEHSQDYRGQTKDLIAGCSNVTLLHCPIETFSYRFKKFATYAPHYLRQLRGKGKLDLVLIDGPPGNRFGREAPLYQIAPYLTKETVILLDDANRKPEREAVANWNRAWADGFDEVNFPELKKGFSVLSLKETERRHLFPFSLNHIKESRSHTDKVIEKHEILH